MARFKAKKEETMLWLGKTGVMIAFKEGQAIISDKKQIKEMESFGYVDLDKETPNKPQPEIIEVKEEK